MRRLPLCLLLACVLGAPALAAAPKLEAQKTRLYVRARATRLLKTASAASAPVALLNPGDEVVWLGQDPKDKRYHHVKAKAGRGYVLGSALQFEPPRKEVTSTKGDTQDARAFLTSAAATKALGQGAIEYGKQQNMEESVQQLQQLEKVAAEVTPAVASAHAKAAGLTEAIGAQARRSP